MAQREQGRIQTKTKGGGVTGRPSANRGVCGHAPPGNFEKQGILGIFRGGGGYIHPTPQPPGYGPGESSV